VEAAGGQIGPPADHHTLEEKNMRITISTVLVAVATLNTACSAGDGSEPPALGDTEQVGQQGEASIDSPYREGFLTITDMSPTPIFSYYNSAIDGRWN